MRVRQFRLCIGMKTTTKTETPIAEPESGKNPDAEFPSEIKQPDPEADRLRDENEQLKRTLQLREARELVIEALTKIGATSPGLLFAAIKDELQFDENGTVVNAAAIADHLKKSYPNQFALRPSHSSIDGAAGTTAQPEPMSARTLAGMTPAQIKKLDWDEVRRVLSSEF